MARARASVFDEADLDVSDFAPKPAQEGVNKEQVRAVAEPVAFRSREAAAAPPAIKASAAGMGKFKASARTTRKMMR